MDEEKMHKILKEFRDGKIDPNKLSLIMGRQLVKACRQMRDNLLNSALLYKELEKAVIQEVKQKHSITIK